MNIANAIRSSVVDKMPTKGDGSFTPDGYTKIHPRTRNHEHTPGYIINVEDVQQTTRTATPCSATARSSSFTPKARSQHSQSQEHKP